MAKSAKGAVGGKKQVKDLNPNSGGVKGGSKVMANAHEMKKALIANFPR